MGVSFTSPHAGRSMNLCLLSVHCPCSLRGNDCLNVYKQEFDRDRLCSCASDWDIFHTFLSAVSEWKLMKQKISERDIVDMQTLLSEDSLTYCWVTRKNKNSLVCFHSKLTSVSHSDSQRISLTLQLDHVTDVVQTHGSHVVLMKNLSIHEPQQKLLYFLFIYFKNWPVSNDKILCYVLVKINCYGQPSVR